VTISYKIILHHFLFAVSTGVFRPFHKFFQGLLYRITLLKQNAQVHKSLHLGILL